MKHTNTFLMAFALFTALVLIATLITSCKRADKQFIGTYIGSSKINGGADFNDTVFVYGDSSNTSDILVYDALYQFKIYGSVSSNNITIASQQVTEKTNSGLVTYSGTGTLQGSTLSLDFTGTGSNSIDFKGNK